MPRRAGLWIPTFTLSGALTCLVGGGANPYAHAVAPLPPLRTAAPSSLPPPAQQLQSAPPAARACSARELGARGADSIASVPSLVALLADDTIVSIPDCIDSGDGHGRLDDVIDCPTSPAREASRALARIGASAVQPLLTALGDVRATMRLYAVIALGLIDDGGLTRSVTAHLSTTVNDSDWQVRRSAVWALSAHADASVFVPVSGRLKDESARVREMAARGLGRIEDARAVTALIAALPDPEWSVRREIVHSLGELHAAEAVDAIVQRLGDERS